METVNKAKSESDVQKYIKDNQKWFIPGSLFRNYDFGHHEAYISPEQSLEGNYRVDYMLLGRNSVGYHIVFVEFESVNVEYRNTSDNSETQYVRKGLTQIVHIGNSIVYSPGGLSSSDSNKLPAHLNNFIEIMCDGSARMRV